jgi:beta-fructofuranosidase
VALRLNERWVWDFWLARDGADHHLFFLQAPRELGDPDLRHRHATIGHAASTDLVAWDVLPDALAPGPPGAWDDHATWTGSVLRHGGRWNMLYTGTRREERGLVQRIGLATSDDLVHWRKHGANPVLETDPRWYELLNLDAWHDQAWRDPWLFHDPVTGDVHALITARSASGPPDGRGVLAHARSSDLVRWEIGPPIVSPGEFGELEVPQVVSIGSRWHLLFSVGAASHGTLWRRRTGQSPRSAVYNLIGDAPLGPFTGPPGPVAVRGPDEVLYAGKLVEEGNGGWVFLATRLFGPDGAFVGELGDPVAVTLDPAGRLVIGA